MSFIVCGRYQMYEGDDRPMVEDPKMGPGLWFAGKTVTSFKTRRAAKQAIKRTTQRIKQRSALEADFHIYALEEQK